MKKRYPIQDRYIKVAINEELYDHLRGMARAEKRTLNAVGYEFLSEMLERGYRFRQPIDKTLSVRDISLEKIKILAGRSNMSIKQYITAYTEHINNEDTNAGVG